MNGIDLRRYTIIPPVRSFWCTWTNSSQAQIRFTEEHRTFPWLSRHVWLSTWALEMHMYRQWNITTHRSMYWFLVHFTACSVGRDENGSDTDGYHRYYICFYIFVRIRIQIRIVSTMSDMIRLDIDIINMRFEYSNTDAVSDIEYLDSDMDRSELL